MYDIIGDIHGRADELEALLLMKKMPGIMLSLLPSFPLVLIDTMRPLTGSKACRCLLGITGWTVIPGL